jgi:SARP family transcriptional regulator, regulator of embCAB operon
MRIEINVLGILEATVEGRSIVPTARKQRQLLAVLALNAGHIVTTSALIEELWDSMEPRCALGILQTYVLKLRRGIMHALAENGQGSAATDILVTEHNGYLLNVPNDAVDARRYDQLSVLGRGAVDAGDHPAAARTLGMALDLWRGPAFVDIPPGPLVRIGALRLEENRLSDLYLRIEADLRLGKHHQLLGELATICARHQWLENFHELFMVALCRSGQQWRALEIYRQLRTTLVSHLGIDPSPQLQQLHQAILTGEPVGADTTFAVERRVPVGLAR